MVDVTNRHANARRKIILSEVWSEAQTQLQHLLHLERMHLHRQRLHRFALLLHAEVDLVEVSAVEDFLHAEEVGEIVAVEIEDFHVVLPAVEILGKIST